MDTNEIKFGTEGWRGIISREYTFENVAKVAQAVAVYLNNKNDIVSKKITIGYDNRFMSEKFAELSAKVFKKNGFKVCLSDSSVTTPNLCHATKTNNSRAGIMITASHNPARFNGLKIKASYGGPVPESLNKEVEKIVENISETDVYEDINVEELTDIKPSYIEYLKSIVDFKQIKKIKNKIVFDSLHGPASKYIKELFGKSNNVIVIRDKRDPMFGGINPEPIEKNLFLLKQAVLKNKAVAGFALDGDGDRAGVIDDKGKYLPPHIVFPLLLYYLVKYKNCKGKVIQTISLGYLSERIARKYNLEFEVTPVGFKYITERMVKERVLLGGEESSGYSAFSELPDRDGILSSLIILEMLGNINKKMSAVVKEIEKEFGKSYFLRSDTKLDKIIYNKEIFVKQLVDNLPDIIENRTVKEVKTYDGIKIILNDDSWLLMRPSGTEPLLRVYAETPSINTTKRIIEFGKKLVNKALSNLNI